MTDNSQQQGIPIYLDSIDRNIVNAMDEPDINVDMWFPSNIAAQKLWRCLESMRDLEEALEFVHQAKNMTKRKRKLKIALTPLHAFISNIDDLLNDIENNADTRNRLEENDVKDVANLRKQFAEVLPHDHNSLITEMRNKLSSHIDKKLHPSLAQQLASEINQNEFGRWLHICLHLILDLTKLNIYSWSCKPPTEEYVTFMDIEPYILTIKLEGKNGAELVGLNISKNSPKNAIPELVNQLVGLSQWMFKKGQARIANLKEDSKDNWNTFSSNFSNYKKDF